MTKPLCGALAGLAAVDVAGTALVVGELVLSGQDAAAACAAVGGLVAFALIALPVAREGARHPRQVRLAVAVVVAVVAAGAGAALVAIDVAPAPGTARVHSRAVTLGAAAMLAPLGTALLLLTAEAHRARDHGGE